MSSVIDLRRSGRRTDRLWALGIAALAFAVRLQAVLRGGGLFGRIGYDGSVYYASASALSRGILPYRDFLLLHPPGVLLILLPFAVLGRLIGDADAYALARLAWFALGALSAYLVFRLVRPRGLVPAVLAGAFYAVFVPAVTSEHTTSLEAVGSVCLLAALTLLTAERGGRAGRVLRPVVAGALLGLSTGTKIWGVGLALVLIAWSLRQGGVRRALLGLAGSVGGAVAICLPFFLVAPSRMWRMVLADQFGRPRVAGGVGDRLIDIAGLSELRPSHGHGILLLSAVIFLLVLVALSVRDRPVRLAALILGVTMIVMLATPPWSVAYTGLAAPPLALLFGSAVARLLALAGRARSSGSGRWIVSGVVTAGLVTYAAASLPGLTYGSHFPGRSMENALARTPGCVTTDDPIALIETGALQRNFDRRCPVVLDLSGYSYDLQPGAGRQVARSGNDQWQRFAQDQLGSGEVAVVVRFRTSPGLSASTKQLVSTWPILARVGGYQLRHPSRPGRPGPTG